MKKIISAILITAMLITTFCSVQAAADLSSEKQDFFDMIVAAAIANMPKSNVIASVVIAQAILESGWGQDSMPKATKNLFCIKAYTTWTGRIYCNPTGKFYSSIQDLIAADKATYNKYVNNFYRVYDSYAESIKDHGELMNKGSYAKNIPGNDDYKAVCKLLVDCGYTPETSYTTKLIKVIEEYELYQYDSLEASVDATGIKLNTSSVNIKIGGEYQLAATVNPSNAKNKTVTYKSSDSSVVSVTSGGKLKGLKSGMATITASTTNGKTAQVSVFCSSTGVVAYKGETTQTIYCRAKMDTGSTVYGSIQKGTSVVIQGNAVNGWYHVTGKNSSGVTLRGYVYSSYIKITGVHDTGTASNDMNQNPEIKLSKTAENRNTPLGSENNSILFNKTDNSLFVGADSNGEGYYVINITVGGKTVLGWWGGEYIEVQKESFTARTALGENCFIDSDGYFRGVPAGTAAGELSELYDEISVTVKDKNGNILKGNEAVCTGDIIEMYYEGIKVFDNALAVTGDVTGDGAVNALDYMNIRNMCLGVKTLEGAYLKAADVNGDGKTDAMDYLVLRRIISEK